jgi:hypothetical protein
MRPRRSIRVFRFFFPAAVSLAIACAASTPVSAPSSQGGELADVVDAIQQALGQAAGAEVPGFPPLKSATVKLQTEAGRSVGGEIAVYVFTLGATRASETASTIELKMKPPASPRKGLRPEELRDALARAIHMAELGAARAAAGEPPFLMEEVAIDLKFTVEASGEGGAKVRLVPLGVEASGGIHKNQIHTITLVFHS